MGSHRTYLLFSIKIPGLLAFDEPTTRSGLEAYLPAVGIIAAIAGRVVGNHEIHELFGAGIADLMSFPRAESERISRPRAAGWKMMKTKTGVA